MLSVQALTLERHFQPVFEPVSFELGARQLLTVTGPNGSGKTTLIRLLAGLLTPTTGTVKYGLGAIVYLGHEHGIKAELTVRENLRFVKSLSASEGDVEAAIETMGLRRVAGQPGRTLSAGQIKRAALARLILIDAPLWLLDEPYANMDAEGIELVDRLMDDHLSNGGGCVMATHGSHRPSPWPVSDPWQTVEFPIVAWRAAA